MASHIVAGVFNSRRKKASSRWFEFEDFHPLVKKHKRRPSGDEVNARYTSHLAATGQQVDWLDNGVKPSN